MSVSGTSSALMCELQNRTCCNTVYCYITGYNIDQGNKLMLLSSDGITPYYPTNPPADTTCQPIPQDCSIKLGPPGSSCYVQIPHIGGCRIWFSINNKLSFLLNPGSTGPGLVEPSCTNPSDSNVNTKWDFCELTFNQDEAFANISYVDFMCLPISCTLSTTDGTVNHVSGMPMNAMKNICNALDAQTSKDGQPWNRLIVRDQSGTPLRILSPNNGICLDPGMFKGYLEPYVDQVWQQYSHCRLSVDTQAQWGVITGSVSGDKFIFDGNSFSKPSTADIFSCSTGPFDGGTPEQLCIIPRLAAALNRCTLLTSMTVPDPAGPASFYKTAMTNHYSRIIHEQLLDTRGYAFPYDDVVANGGPDQCGAVYNSNPKMLTFAVGGNGAYVDCSSPVINN